MTLAQFVSARDRAIHDDRHEPLLRELFAHRERFIRSAQCVLACRARAEDVVQDAAVRICQGIGVANIAEPGRFLHRMVRNLAIDALRQTRRECRWHASQEAARDIATPCDCPLRHVCERESLRGVLRALEAAPPRTREAFVANRFDDVPQREIAARLGVSATLVNFMIRDATALCREAAHA